MTTILRSNKTIKNLLFLIGVMFLVAISNSVCAQRNVCYECKKINTADSTTCEKCSTALNLCLDCGTENKSSADYCSNCNAPLAEMRLLGKIDPQTRDNLRLGQSQRALLDKELMKVAYLLEKNPDDAERLIFKRSMLLHRMDFHSREAESWREFLERFPKSAKKTVARVYLSEALRKWSFLFYSQKKTDMSLALLKESTEHNPANAEAWQWLGRINMEIKNKAEAKMAYLKALELEPGNKSFIHFLRKLKADIPDNLLKSESR